jgi:hypothetical protein
MPAGRGALTGATTPSVAGDLNCAGRNDDMVRKRLTTACCAHMPKCCGLGAPSVARSGLPDFACGRYLLSDQGRRRVTIDPAGGLGVKR